MRYFIFLVMLSLTAARAQTAPAPPDLPVNSWFIPNVGQISDIDGKPLKNVLFKMERPGFSVLVTDKGLTYVFTKRGKDSEDGEEQEESRKNPSHHETANFVYERFDLELEGAVISRSYLVTENPSKHYYNFYNAPLKKPVTGVHACGRLTFRNIYPGIDWVLYADEKNATLKYDFIVHPGADPAQIRLLYRGEMPLQLKDDRTISFKTGLGGISDHIPVAYCEEKTNSVDIRYSIHGNEQKQNAVNRWNETKIGFELGKYNHKQLLVIDPAQLAWGTYFGGSTSCRGHAVAVDTDKNFYVAGEASFVGMPVFNPGNGAYFDATAADPADIFIAEFDSMHTLLWSTYCGGIGMDWVNNIAVMSNRNLVVVGMTQCDSLIMQDPGGGAYYADTLTGLADGFILRFSQVGIMNWGTYFSSLNDIFGSTSLLSMTIDPNDNIYMCGLANGNNPMNASGPAGSYQQAMGNLTSGILLRFTSNAVLDWFTFFGDGASMEIRDIKLDNLGRIIITGNSSSPINIPVTVSTLPNSFNQVTSGGMWDGFMARFGTGLVLEWCSYIGWADNDQCAQICIAPDNSFYITGGFGFNSALSVPFVNPGGGAYFSNTPLYGQYLSHFTSSLELDWLTRLDGAHGNITGISATSIAPGKCGSVYIGFYTATPLNGNDSVKTVNPGNGAYYFGACQGLLDVYIAQFNSAHQMIWASYFGGEATEDGIVLCTDYDGDLYATGDGGGLSYTSSTISSFQNNCTLNPGNGAYFQNMPYCFFDYCYLTKFNTYDNGGLTGSVVYQDPSCINNYSGSISVNISGGLPPYSIYWNPTGSTSTTLTGLGSGTFIYTLTDSAGCTGGGTVLLHVDPVPDVVITSPDSMLCTGDTTVLTASGAPTFTWTPGSQTGTSITVSPNATTTYYASYNYGPGCMNSDSMTVTVSPYPVPVISAPASVCSGEQYTITGSGGSSSNTWLNSSNPNPFSYTFYADTTFTLVSENSGCFDTLSVFVSVSPCTGTEENPASGFTIMPNPFQDQLRFELPSNGEWLIEVYDAQGKLVTRTLCSGGKGSIGTDNWAEGLYTIRFSREGTVHAAHIIRNAGSR